MEDGRADGCADRGAAGRADGCADEGAADDTRVVAPLSGLAVSVIFATFVQLPSTVLDATAVLLAAGKV